jgi:DNA-binding GntR family transcriptional regulator
MVRLGVFGNLVAMISAPELHPHTSIVDALASGDPQRADEEMRKHCGTNRERVLQAARECSSVEES